MYAAIHEGKWKGMTPQNVHSNKTESFQEQQHSTADILHESCMHHVQDWGTAECRKMIKTGNFTHVGGGERRQGGGEGGEGGRYLQSVCEKVGVGHAPIERPELHD